MLRVKRSLIAFDGNPSQSYGASPAICDHTVLGLPATRHQWTRPALTQPQPTPICLPRKMKGWVDLRVGYIPKWFTCLQTVTHPSTCSNHLIATRPVAEPTTTRS